MKMKSFALLAISGLMVATLAYVAPAVADDTSNGQTMQAPADTQMPNSSMPAASNDNANTTNDESTPDTATGDDDY